MKYGIQHEEAANEYADLFEKAVYPVGFVINPFFPFFQLPAGKQ